MCSLPHIEVILQLTKEQLKSQLVFRNETCLFFFTFICLNSPAMLVSASYLGLYKLHTTVHYSQCWHSHNHLHVSRWLQNCYQVSMFLTVWKYFLPWYGNWLLHTLKSKSHQTTVKISEVSTKSHFHIHAKPGCTQSRFITLFDATHEPIAKWKHGVERERCFKRDKHIL